MVNPENPDVEAFETRYGESEAASTSAFLLQMQGDAAYTGKQKYPNMPIYSMADVFKAWTPWWLRDFKQPGTVNPRRAEIKAKSSQWTNPYLPRVN